eukprot:5043830-Prymnesium_polylepis.1
MQSATSDQQIAELRRELNASRQTISRLQQELSSARADARRRSDAAPSRPPPPPTPPPGNASPADSWSPGRKAGATAAMSRVPQLEAELEAERERNRRQADEMRALAASEERLRAELQQRKGAPAPAPPAGPSTHELKKLGAELERAKAELEQEREQRRSLQRRLSDRGRPNARAIAAEQIRGTTTEDDEMARKDAMLIAKLSELGQQMGKMEKQKMSVEDMCAQASKPSRRPPDARAPLPSTHGDPSRRLRAPIVVAYPTSTCRAPVCRSRLAAQNETLQKQNALLKEQVAQANRRGSTGGGTLMPHPPGSRESRSPRSSAYALMGGEGGLKRSSFGGSGE